MLHLSAPPPSGTYIPSRGVENGGHYVTTQDGASTQHVTLISIVTNSHTYILCENKSNRNLQIWTTAGKYHSTCSQCCMKKYMDK